ncbi:hypothetical protein Q2941_50095 [Bradyrhizobium sp. UFLA05-153]
MVTFVEKGAFDEAIEVWSCALTAFEVARRRADDGDPQSGDVSAKIEAGVQRFGSLEQKVERMDIACRLIHAEALVVPIHARRRSFASAGKKKQERCYSQGPCPWMIRRGILVWWRASNSAMSQLREQFSSSVQSERTV